MPKGSLSKVEFEYYKRQARWIALQLGPAHLVDDLIGAAMEGLVVALRKFDPSKHVGLGSYVIQKLRWSILDALRAWRAGTRADAAKGIFYQDVPFDEAMDPPTPPAVDTDELDLERAVATLPPKRRAFMEAFLKCDDVAMASASIGVSTACDWQLHWQSVQALRKILDGPPE